MSTGVLRASLKARQYNGQYNWGMSWSPPEPTACADAPELFFGDTVAEQKAGARLCNGCPFVKECLQVGLQEEYGVWGGRTEKELNAARGLFANGKKFRYADDLECAWCFAPYTDLRAYESKGTRWPERGVKCTNCGLRWIASGAWEALRKGPVPPAYRNRIKSAASVGGASYE